MPLIFVKILTHKVPRIWGSCELRITDSRRCHASSSIKCHVISIIPFWGARNQLLLLTSQKCLLLTFKRYCNTEVASLLSCLSQPRNFEEYKAHIALQQNQKDLCYFIASTSCPACCPQLVEEIAIYLDKASSV